MSKKILLIEDDKFLTNDLEVILDIYDYQTETLNNVDGIVNIDDFEQYKCVFLDVMMRSSGILMMKNFKESGEAAYSYIREKSQVPIFIMSAMDKDDIKINFNKPNVTYIKKPFSGMDQILKLVNSI
jgi:DNA-binding response OmpR family regulator